MKIKSSMIRKVQLAFGSAILTLLVVGVMSYRGIILSSESYQRVRHTDDVLENLQDLLTSMQSAESSSRGFALTASEEYVESFHAGVLRSQQDQTALRNLTVDNPTQQRQFATLDRLTNQKIEFGQTVIGLRRTQGMEAAADVIEGGRGQQIIVNSYRLRANCYLTKPVQLDAFEALGKSINDFWLTKVKLPQQRQNG
jgi:CHASE3 domain sensor protein